MSGDSPETTVVVRSSIRRKLVTVVLAGITTAILLATLANSWREAQRFGAVKRAEIEGTAHVFASTVADAVAAGDRIGTLKTLRAIGRIPSFTHVSVIDAQGRSLAELGATVALEENDDLPIFLRRSMSVDVPIMKGGVQVGRLLVWVTTGELRKRLVDGLLTGLIAALISALVGLAIAFRLQKTITDPLRRLTTTMFEVQRTQDFDKLVEHRSDDETGVLVSAFNHMLTQIRDRDNRLARHREQLEVTVDERTRDLRVAKEAAEEANAAKSGFLATMSHEIRTPMNGMLVMAELLASANLNDRHRRYADVVVKSGQSLLTIINDILDFSKIESGKLELEIIDLDPAELIDDVLSLFWERAASKGLDIAGYVAPDVPARIQGDPVRLNQVVSNLVNNALKFTETGHVKVLVETVGAAASDDQLTIAFRVRDTGIGIPQEKLGTIFESFSQADQTTTRRFGGTGLGLAICKRLVEAMAGKIEVTSREGEGSEFAFTIETRAMPVTEPAKDEAKKDFTNAVVAISGEASARVIADYVGDRRIGTLVLPPRDLSHQDLGPADLIFAETDVIDRLNLSGEAEGVPGQPYVICVTQLGDTRSDAIIEQGLAQDVLMLPVSRSAMGGLIDRLEAGAPRGRSILDRRETRALPSFPDAKVLVADDSPVNREVVIEALKQLDVRADVVADGAAAVRAADERPYDLVFMDCSMPEMDGFEATRHIRTKEPEGQRMPIVALTAHIAGGQADEWQRAGMDDYMTKPFRITDLVSALERFLPAELCGGGADSVPRETPEVPLLETPVAESSNELPLIDEEVLNDVAGCQDGDGGELVLRVLSLFEEHAPPALLHLAECAGEQGMEEIASAAHALKSMCRNIGASRLAAVCQKIEAEALEGQASDLPASLRYLHSELVATLARIADLKTEREAQVSRAS